MRIAIFKPWRWAHRIPSVVFEEMSVLLRRVGQSRTTLWAVTRVEFHKKYAGSVLGLLWYPLYSALLLAMYCFVYMVILSMKLKEMGSYHFVLFIFAGLIPYLGFSDAVATSVTSIKANITLVKNAVFPVELIPLKQLLVSMAGLFISLAILILLIVPTSLSGWHLLYLPVPIVLLFLFSLGVIWILSAIAVLVLDLTYIVNLLLLFMIFVSPIGFKLDQVPGKAVLLLYLNPLTYLIESFRYALIGIRSTPLWLDGAFCIATLMLLCVAGTFFRRMMPLFSDYE